jgi:hypothetical protein
MTTTYPEIEFVRCEPCPARVKLQIRLRRESSPGLAEWVWDHPYVGAIVVKAVLERALRIGELDAMDKEIRNARR